ncbi:MAG: hypothetical protein ACYC96_16015 [Fimbriimonadaceae bacterium]
MNELSKIDDGNAMFQKYGTTTGGSKFQYDVTVMQPHGYATIRNSFQSSPILIPHGWPYAYGTTTVFGGVMPDVMLANKIITTANTIGEMMQGLSRDDWEALSEEIADAAFSGNEPTAGIVSVLYQWYPESFSFSGAWHMTPALAESWSGEISVARETGRTYKIA